MGEWRDGIYERNTEGKIEAETGKEGDRERKNLRSRGRERDGHIETERDKDGERNRSKGKKTNI